MKFSGGPVNANRGFSAALHARATRGILFSYGSIARAPSFQRLHLTWGEEEGGNILCSWKRFFLVSIRTEPSSLLPQIFPAPIDTVPDHVDRCDFFVSKPSCFLTFARSIFSSL